MKSQFCIIYSLMRTSQRRQTDDTWISGTSALKEKQFFQFPSTLQSSISCSRKKLPFSDLISCIKSTWNWNKANKTYNPSNYYKYIHLEVNRDLGICMRVELRQAMSFIKNVWQVYYIFSRERKSFKLKKSWVLYYIQIKPKNFTKTYSR